MDDLAGLPAIDLDSLNATAELLVRTDRKYVVPQHDLRGLLRGLPGLRVLEIDGRRASTYESTYFDTTELTSWAASAHPRRRRWKVRTRVYADTGECWLEVKTRGGRGETVKERMPYDASSRDDIGDEAAMWLSARLGAGGSVRINVHGLVPTLRTSYQRSTILLPDGAGRATIDRRLVWSSPFGRAALDAASVVESKTPPGAAGPLDRHMWGLGHRPRRISKYGTGLALLTPELPANRWHRVITRDLAANLTITRDIPA
ncbi:polyphosphate polymerase domain-containing protein [Nocardioides abyssi]|uniref:Polyphosphate polymerase domain-containing protein n=1 Tax=Nocardioides abyssi TaxID=3058370 RepID=A0ABT8EYS5_9ACTN|nr:polyphosphate polymerase domain-containing protein [Nocardioides abyssi]MDN4162981.1 polyphosphate polymerase domain-containing protein [Nocardioides abyssi]